MKSILQLPIIRELQARSLLFPALVLLAVIGILLHGALDREVSRQTPPRAETPSPAAVPGLRPELEKTPLTYVSDYWRQLGERIQNKIVLLGPRRMPGIMVAPAVALTSIQAADDVVAEQWQQQAAQEHAAASQDAVETDPESSRLPYELLGVDSELGVALFAVKQGDPAAVFALAEPATPPPGAYVAAVSLTPDGGLKITPGHVVSLGSGSTAAGRRHLEVAIPFPESFGVAAIVNLDGRLVGAAIPSGGAMMNVLSADTVSAIVKRLSGGEACQAIEVAELSDEVRSLLRLSSGVVVERVREEAFVPEPSIREGDILLSWNGHTINSVEEFGKLYHESEAGSLVRYLVVRNRGRASGATRKPGPDCRPVLAPLHVYAGLGITLRWAEEWRVAGVIDDSPAARGGLEQDDVIVGSDGGDFGEDSGRRLFESLERRPRPVVLKVRRGDRVKLLAISPGSG